MQESTVLNLFKEFTNGTVDLFGLKCIPVVINNIHESGESTYQIGFEIENPSNVSYFGPIVHEELLELVNSFGEYINIKVVPIILWGHHRTEFHLNGEIRNKFKLTVRDLDKDHTNEFQNKGAAIANSPKELAQQVDLIITCLPSPKICAEVMEGNDGVIAGISKNKIWLEMSTTDESEIKRLGKLVKEREMKMNQEKKS